MFCHCVSLGFIIRLKHCQAWLGVHIEKAFMTMFLDSLNVGMVLDIPGRMSRGDWKVGTFVDDRLGVRFRG